MQLKCNWQNDKSFYEKSESYQISHTEMLVTYNLQRCNVFLILYFPCCYSVTAVQIQIECLFDFKLFLPPLAQGSIISFKIGQRIHIISKDEHVKMYLAKTNLHKYYTIYYVQTLLCAEFSLARIYKSNLKGRMLAIYAPAGLLYLDYMRILFKPDLSELFGALCWTNNFSTGCFAPKQIHKPTKESIKTTPWSICPTSSSQICS